MSMAESLLFAAVMTMIEELNSEKDESATTDLPINSEINIHFDFDNMQAKDSLVSLARTVYGRADEVAGERNELDTDLLVSALIGAIVFETVDAVDAGYEKKRALFDYALCYCNVDVGFTWDELHSESDQHKSNFLYVGQMCLDTIFVASTIGNGDEYSTKFIQLLTELMLQLEDTINKRFSGVNFEKRFITVALDRLLAAMKKEMNRLEEEDPSLKEDAASPKDTTRINKLLSSAREALKRGEMSQAAAYYRAAANIDPDNWEALLYKELCSSFVEPEAIASTRVYDNTNNIKNAMALAMPKVKKQILVRPQLIAELSDVCSCLCQVTSFYFVEIMNEYRNAGSILQTRKTNQINMLIQMLFSSGSAIEETFGDDFELCKNLCSALWQIAFDCYENCNMEAPSNLYDYYQKMLKYNPSFRCSKPLISNSPTGTNGGCYVATAVYGSYDCPQVWTLRRYRDFSLAKTSIGRAFIHFYYAASPLFVKWFGKTKWFNRVFRKFLDRFVILLSKKGFENTPYSD